MADTPQTPSKGSEAIDRIKWLFNNASSNMRSGPGILPLLMMGMTGQPMPGFNYRHFYNQAINRGQNPAEVLPWLNGDWSGSSQSSSNQQPANPIGGMPQWYQDWYSSQGKFGGPRGLL
jgi:hypothetical protein